MATPESDEIESDVTRALGLMSWIDLGGTTAPDEAACPAR